MTTGLSDLREAVEYVERQLKECGYEPDEEYWDVCDAARRFLALTETGPDYEAARKHPAARFLSASQVYQIVDAALADYLTEEGP